MQASNFTHFIFFCAFFAIALPFYLCKEFINAIIFIYSHPEVRFFFTANRDEFLEFVDSFGYVIANLRCYTQNIFASEEVIELKYFE